jgi:hypothetical protein
LAGLEDLFLIGNNITQAESEYMGFDGFTQHFPNWKLMARYPWLDEHFRPSFSSKLVGPLEQPLRQLRNSPRVRSYHKLLVQGAKAFHATAPNHFPLAVTNWDNTPRVGWRGLVLAGATPANFAQHFRSVLNSVINRPPQTRIIFLKSWNEWAEGNYIEPDQEYGRQRLEALREALYDKPYRSPAG